MATMDDLAQTVLTAVTGKDVRSAMAQAISQWDSAKGDIFERLEAVEAKANQASQDVDDLRNRIDEVNIALNQRIDELNQRKADLDEMNKRINHVVLGKDDEALQAAVTQILKDKGVI
ncbi:hypothetical protein HCY90_08310 [Limosilactobacillus fermentum]